MELFCASFESPIGIVEVTATASHIVTVDFVEEAQLQTKQPEVLQRAITQLREYFAGTRQVFDVPYQFNGTVFQQKVWYALTTVPYNKTASYKDIAIYIGNEKAVRAVGMTNGKNPISIIVPCHRIIGSNGKLTGYAGGVWRKEWLLHHEQQFGGAL